MKVHAEEVEAALMRCPSVRQAAAVGVTDATWGRRIEAFVVPAEPEARPESIIAFCRDNGLLPPARLPKAIRFVEALPTGPTGKLSRAALRALGGG
jgi:acyl-CoA synthetase (AMP-forming)/AMP-acid ligase II